MTAGSQERASSPVSSLVARVRVAVIVLAAWIAFSALQLSVSAALAKPGSIPWGRELLVDLTMALYWWAVTLPIAAWHRRLRASGLGVPATIAGHLPLLALVTLGDTFSTRASLRLFAHFIPQQSALAAVTYFADFDALSYLAVVVITDALIARAAVRAEDRRASRLEGLVARARLEYLEAQLQPHFLFNALGAVSELAYEAPSTALRVLRQLARIFRGALASRPGEVTLGEELVAIEPYLDIQRLRFPDWLRIDYDVGGETLDCLVPRFVLQPLVENAIRHGLTGRVAAGCIEISSRVAGERLILRVADNGVGLRQLATRSGYGIGLTNVRERLTTLYGPGEQLRLLDAAGGGAVAEVALPARRATDASDTGLLTAPADLGDTAPNENVLPDGADERPSPSWQRVGRGAAIALVAGLLWTIQSYAYLRIRNRLGNFSLRWVAGYDFAAALLYACMAPAILFLTSRYPLTRGRLYSRGTAYLGIMASFAVFHEAVLNRVFTPQTPLWSPASANGLVLNSLVLSVLVAIGHRRQLREWMRERELAAVALSNELRTARVRAARMQEIPPVVLYALDRVIDAVSVTPVPSPRRTEQLLARLGDYLRVAIECGDEQGITASREQLLARSLAQFERVARGAHTSVTSL